MKKLSVVVLVALLVSATANAKMAIQKQFAKNYKSANTIVSCVLCHTSDDPEGEDSLNPYGIDLAKVITDIKKVNFALVEALDSDGDGVANLAEIMADKYPGDASSKLDSIVDQLTDEEIKEVAEYYNSL